MKRRRLRLIDVIVMILISVLFGSFGQIYLKKGLNISPLAASEVLSPKFFRTVFQPYVLLGIGLYVIATVVWLLVLSKAQISYAYPLIGLGYALTALLARFYFGEEVTMVRWLGIFVIILGAFLVTRG